MTLHPSSALRAYTWIPASRTHCNNVNTESSGVLSPTNLTPRHALALPLSPARRMSLLAT
eukprot:CAMPEP_0180363426 /NCGR_PEP_ID=MMETSP0989-20121125/14007_1 /TAXON_ID=697907 /ORGANISM="non described non described, Strain CCMP2293" /LENGTH=59 /DNA_ID=CAMNT_0022355837 /DNA_START=263 /DNA_END=442 /DNA_ORIENTATION=-